LPARVRDPGRRGTALPGSAGRLRAEPPSSSRRVGARRRGRRPVALGPGYRGLPRRGAAPPRRGRGAWRSAPSFRTLDGLELSADRALVPRWPRVSLVGPGECVCDWDGGGALGAARGWPRGRVVAWKPPSKAAAWLAALDHAERLSQLAAA